MKCVVLYGCLVMVATVFCRVASLEPTGKKDNGEEATLENVPTVSKRQTNFQNNNFDQQQIPQEYFDFVQQTDAAGNVRPQPQFNQQTGPQQFFVSGYPPRTTTTLSPFATEQKRLQEEYARRTLVEQQTALLRNRQRPAAAQPLPPQFQQVQPQQPQPLQFLDQNGQIRQQEFAPQPQDNSFVLPQQDNNFAPQQQNNNFASRPLQVSSFTPRPQDNNFVPKQQQDNSFAPQQQNFLQSTDEGSQSFSYAQVQFGPASTQQAEPAVSRPKGQRSVSKPRVQNNNVVIDPVTQPTVDRPVASAIVSPAQLNARLLQNVVYIQPNGQMYKPIEETEQVVQIPRRNHYYYQTSEGPTVSATSAAASTTVAPRPAEEEPVILIPRPKKPINQRPRQETQKSGRTQQQQSTRAEAPIQQQAYQLQPEQSSSEVEPDNFLTSLLSQLQLQQQQQQQQQLQEDTTTLVPPKSSRGSQRLSATKANRRPEATTKYLDDRSQLQLLQFPHELETLSGAELKALEEANAQIATPAVNDKSKSTRQRQQKQQPIRHRPTTSTTKSPPPPPPPSRESEEFDEQALFPRTGNRPVPTPVELDDQQRQFLAAQGIRHLYRVDYDQSGNVLPLTYVLALDGRPKRDEQSTES
ncbi:Hypothetical protein CINCED_3A020573 [Cinara cedri]|uniref:Insect cuticle protein n=1 Tax=Cinara cedri TaxID=506608 RepID=A0A5E4MRW0_9HEMI|nr:Hypothetical protein CINCED_3A020573 [Cinara cedri]